jgi:hypothetical protein
MLSSEVWYADAVFTRCVHLLVGQLHSCERSENEDLQGQPT